MGVYYRDGPRGRVYWIRYMVFGKRFKESLGARSTERQAWALLHRRITEARQGQVHLPRRACEKVGDVLGRYVEHAGSIGRRSVRSMRGKARVIGESWIAGEAAARLSTAQIERYVSERLESKRRPAPATVNRELELLRAAMRWAHRRGEVPQVPRVARLQQPPGRVRYLSDDEEVRLLAACSPRLRALVLLALHTGARLGELLALRWRDVDLAAGLLHLERSAPGGDLGTKSGQRRDVPANAVARQVLDGLGRGDAVELLLGPWSAASHIFAAAAADAGIPDVRFHDLRHTFASRLVMCGVGLRTVADLLGHRTLAMVMRYSHLSPGHLRDAVEVLAPHLAPRQPVAPRKEPPKRKRTKRNH